MAKSFIGDGSFTFEFDDDWFEGEHHRGRTDGWAHHGIVVTDSDEVMVFDEKQSLVEVLGLDGALVRSFPVDVIEGHGMYLERSGGQQSLWISDNGSKRCRDDDGSYSGNEKPLRGKAVKYSFDGIELCRIGMPALEVYEAGGDFCPTQVAVDDADGGTGDIWITDCYGQGIVHRFDRNGTYLSSLYGTEGAGRFAHPHSVFIDRRTATPELYVADRRNKRIQIFDLEGVYSRTFGADYLVSPGGFANYGDNLLIAELDGRITVVGPDNNLITHLGVYDPSARSRPGWPNAIGVQGSIRPPLASGAFNTPHAMAVDRYGSIYVCEFLIGGRLVKLTHVEDVSS